MRHSPYLGSGPTRDPHHRSYASTPAPGGNLSCRHDRPLADRGDAADVALVCSKARANTGAAKAPVSASRSPQRSGLRDDIQRTPRSRRSGSVDRRERAPRHDCFGTIWAVCQPLVAGRRASARVPIRQPRVAIGGRSRLLPLGDSASDGLLGVAEIRTPAFRRSARPRRVLRDVASISVSVGRGATHASTRWRGLREELARLPTHCCFQSGTASRRRGCN
jgi:hypothetical protein